MTSSLPTVPVLAAPAEDPTPGVVARWIREQTDNDLLVALADGFIDPIAETILIVVLAWVALRLVRRGIAKAVEEAKDPDTHRRLGTFTRRMRIADLQEGQGARTARRAQRADALGALARSVAAGVIWAIAVMMIMAAFGVALGPLIASAGIVGVALGFGSQALVKDFLSGVFMLIEDQYGVGDVIDAGEASGAVEGISLRTTRIRDVNGTLWHVPNGEIRRVGNMSQGWARTLLDIDVAYGTDVERAMDLILEVACDMAVEPEYADRFLSQPEMWGVENFGPDGVALRLVIQTVPGAQWAIGRELRRRLKAAFDEAGIEIPFPQRTVWVRGEHATAEHAGLTTSEDGTSDHGRTT